MVKDGDVEAALGDDLAELTHGRLSARARVDRVKPDRKTKVLHDGVIFGSGLSDDGADHLGPSRQPAEQLEIADEGPGVAAPKGYPCDVENPHPGNLPSRGDEVAPADRLFRDPGTGAANARDDSAWDLHIDSHSIDWMKL
jgi:hypothetical protein